MDSSIRQIVTSPRAMVVLYVGWSIYAVRDRKLSKSVTEDLADAHIDFAVLDEDLRSTLDWLNSLGVEGLRSPCPGGWGTIIWLESGRVVDYQPYPSTMPNPGKLCVKQLVERTRKRWTERTDEL